MTTPVMERMPAIKSRRVNAWERRIEQSAVVASGTRKRTTVDSVTVMKWMESGEY